jgi:hypothetical protein
VLGGVNGNLLLPLQSMNRLNQTEPAIFSILSFEACFKDLLLSLYFVIYTLLQTFGAIILAKYEKKTL